jgi:RHS repeat-associated protein
VEAAFEYSATGRILKQTGAAGGFPFGYASQYTDRETGLVYYGLRYYKPDEGRFINRDPIGVAGGLNLYAMVGNQAGNAWDVLGLSSGPRVRREPRVNPKTGEIEYTEVVEEIEQLPDMNVTADRYDSASAYAMSREILNMLSERNQSFNGQSSFYSQSEGAPNVRLDVAQVQIKPREMKFVYSNSQLRETDGVGGGSKLPELTQSQIDGVVAVWSKYGIRFSGSAREQAELKRLFAQAVLFRRPSGLPALAIRNIISVLLECGGAPITIGFGLGNETVHDRDTERGSIITIERYTSTGFRISPEQMVVSVMHEMLHATDRIRGGIPIIDIQERHNEIYRIQNQTLADFGLDADPGPRGVKIDTPEKYNGPQF